MATQVTHVPLAVLVTLVRTVYVTRAIRVTTKMVMHASVADSEVSQRSRIVRSAHATLGSLGLFATLAIRAILELHAIHASLVTTC